LRGRVPGAALELDPAQRREAAHRLAALDADPSLDRVAALGRHGDPRPAALAAEPAIDAGATVVEQASIAGLAAVR